MTTSVLRYITIFFLVSVLVACSSKENTNVIEDANEAQNNEQNDTVKYSFVENIKIDKEDQSNILSDNEAIEVFDQAVHSINLAWNPNLMDRYSEEHDDWDLHSEEAYNFFYEETKESMDRYIDGRETIKDIFDELISLRLDHKYKNFLFPLDQMDITVKDKSSNTFTIQTEQISEYYPSNHPDYESGIAHIKHDIIFAKMDDTWKITDITFHTPNEP